MTGLRRAAAKGRRALARSRGRRDRILPTPVDPVDDGASTPMLRGHRRDQVQAGLRAGDAPMRRRCGSGWPMRTGADKGVGTITICFKDGLKACSASSGRFCNKSALARLTVEIQTRGAQGQTPPKHRLRFRPLPQIDQGSAKLQVSFCQVGIDLDGLPRRLGSNARITGHALDPGEIDQRFREYPDRSPARGRSARSIPDTPPFPAA